jgi:hypothetical protein
MESLGLSIPVQHEYSDPTVELDVERLRTWLSNLPFMNVIETLRLVLNALHSLNEQRLEPEKRFQLLEVFRHTTQRLFVTVDPLHIRQLGLSKSQRMQATAGVEQLLLAIAGGYKIIIRVLYETAATRSGREILGPAVNRAMEHLSLALLDSYRFYRAFPALVFKELHRLYRIARQNGLLGVVVEDGDESDRLLGVSDRYHVVMLLSLTDPFRLAEGEVSLLYDILIDYARKCRVVPGDQWSDASDGQFIIDLNSGDPPRYGSSPELQTGGGQHYLLDAREALDGIREHMMQIPAKVRMQSPEAIILRRLLPEVVDPIATREARYPDSRWTQLFLGLDSIHSHWLKTAGAGKQKVSRGAGREAGEPHACRIIDVSNNGMCLGWGEGSTGDTRVGEILGIVEEDRRLRIGMIRSLRIQREGGMEIGLQLIHGSIASVYCRANDTADEEPIQALFMPADEAERVGATLITISGFHTPGCRLLIDVAGRQVKARAGRCIINGPVIDRFEFYDDEG